MIKYEKQINNSLRQLMKQGKISDKIYQRLSQQIHKQQGFMAWKKYLGQIHFADPFFLIPGSSYKNLNRILTPILKKLPGANNETNTQDARKDLESLTLEDDEQIVSLEKGCTPTFRLERL